MKCEYLNDTKFLKNIFMRNNLSTKFEQLFTKGFTANTVLLIWSLFCLIMINSFLVNFRSMLLKPLMETPVYTAQDVLDRGMIPIIVPGGGQLYRDALITSPRPVYHELFSRAVYAQVKQPCHHVKLLVWTLR